MAHFVALSSTCMWQCFLLTFHVRCADSFHQSFFFLFARRGFPLVMGNPLLPHQCYTLQDISTLLHVHSC
uniref:Putative secreted protein n=1 Tax=Ixodes scapularis TaxID=6945 RepID=A0A4D5RFU9_IXOSC